METPFRLYGATHFIFNEQISFVLLFGVLLKFQKFLFRFDERKKTNEHEENVFENCFFQRLNVYFIF